RRLGGDLLGVRAINSSLSWTAMVATSTPLRAYTEYKSGTLRFHDGRATKRSAVRSDLRRPGRALGLRDAYPGSQVPPVGLSGQECREAPPESRRAEEHRHALLSDVANHGGGIEIRCGVFRREDKGRLAASNQEIAHDERSRPMVSLDEELGLAQDADVDAG